jgi:hypothetical protein
MLQARVLRRLLLAGAVGHLSAASGLVRIGSRLYVVADDEHGLGVFDLADDVPGRLVELFDGVLPAEHAARKAAKPDLEALTALPAFAGFAHGALLAVGSGSRAQRNRGVLAALDGDGALAGPIRPVDLAPLLAPLAIHFPALNIEGAFVSGDRLCLLQRGNTQSPLNACITFGWSEVRRWLESGGAAPAAASITRYELGLLDGVPLSFTDGAALPGGGWAFSAAAEDTSDNYADGRCLGSAVGVVGADAKLRTLERLDLVCKVEGIAASLAGNLLQLLLVTDADDRGAAALLLAGTLALVDTAQ